MNNTIIMKIPDVMLIFSIMLIILLFEMIDKLF